MFLRQITEAFLVRTDPDSSMVKPAHIHITSAPQMRNEKVLSANFDSSGTVAAALPATSRRPAPVSIRRAIAKRLEVPRSVCRAIAKRRETPWSIRCDIAMWPETPWSIRCAGPYSYLLVLILVSCSTMICAQPWEADAAWRRALPRPGGRKSRHG